MPDQKQYLPNLIREKLISRSRNIMGAMKNINGGMPLGAKPLSTKEQLDRWLAETPEDKQALIAQWGPDKFIEREIDMEAKMKRSEAATMRAYGIGEEF